MSEFREPTIRDWKKTILIVGLFVLFLLAAAAALVAFGNAVVFLVGFIAIVAVALFMLVRWHAATTAYRCATCGHEFTISTTTDLISPHMMETKYLKCPACSRRSWAKVLVRA